MGKDYNRQDSAVLSIIIPEQRRQLKENGMLPLFDNMMLTMEKALIPMEMSGIKVDPIARNSARSEFDRLRLIGLREWEFDPITTGTNPLSPADMFKLIYGKLNLPKQYNSDGRLTADAEAINEITKGLLETDPRMDILRRLKSIKRNTKWGETYTRISDRIYPRYAPGGKDDSDNGGRFGRVAATGRLIAKGDKNTGTTPLQTIQK